MNGYGIVIAIICFFCIGIFHPIVIKAEYYWSSRCWPLFLISGIVFLVVSLLVKPILATVSLGVLGCSWLWSILELKEQEKRVKRGWFPENTRRKRRHKSKKTAQAKDQFPILLNSQINRKLRYGSGLPCSWSDLTILPFQYDCCQQPL